MRKRKFKNKLWKFGILLFGIPIVLTNCEKEGELINNSEIQKSIIINQYHLSELNTNSTIENSFKKLNAKKSKEKLFSKLSSEQDLYNFTIDSSNIREVIIDNYKSYTFFIKRPYDTPNYFENFIIEETEQNTTRAFIIKYIPSSPITNFEEHNSFYFEGERIVNRLNLDELGLAHREVCTTVAETWCSWSEDHIAGPSCYLATDGRLFIKLAEDCVDEPDLSGGRGGGGTSGGGEIITAPIQLEDERCPSGSGKIMVDDICVCPEGYTENDNGICIEIYVDFNLKKLTQQEKEKFENAKSELEENCIGKALLKSVKRVNIEMGATLGAGEYNPLTNTIKFRSINEFDSKVLGAELFHAYQQQLYGTLDDIYNGTKATGGSNIEFEEKAFNIKKDLIDGNGIFVFPGEEALLEWLIDLEIMYESLPIVLTQENISSWFNALEAFQSFHEDSNDHYGDPIDYNLMPNAIIILSNKILKSNCN